LFEVVIGVAVSKHSPRLFTQLAECRMRRPWSLLLPRCERFDLRAKVGDVFVPVLDMSGQQLGSCRGSAWKGQPEEEELFERREAEGKLLRRGDDFAFGHPHGAREVSEHSRGVEFPPSRFRIRGKRAKSLDQLLTG
jgi:hypothetical protein